MKKNYIEIVYNGEVVCVAPVKECDPLDYIKKEKVATLSDFIGRLLKRIDDLEQDVKVLKGED